MHGEMTLNLAFLLVCAHRFFLNIDFLLFHVHSIVPFFPKLVIPVHVSMEEPVLKTKAEKSTSVNAVVDGKETIAKKIWQVATDIKKRSYYIFVACKKSRDIDRHHLKVLSSKLHERWIPYFEKT